MSPDSFLTPSDAVGVGCVCTYVTAVNIRKIVACDLQAEALEQPGVLTGANLVFSAPTSAGKSAVAEILALRRLCDPRTADRTVLLALPYVSLCQEKVAHLEKLLRPLDKCDA